MERYDIVIVGTGPAGLSAAITATIRNKKILLIGNKDLSTKIQKAHEIQNYLGLPSVSGEMLAKAFHAHIEQMNIEIVEEKVNTIYAMGSYFSIQVAEQMYESKTVILATGIQFAKPLLGEEELLGQGVSYCATCDAPLYRGKSVAVIGYETKAEKEAEFLSEIAERVYYIPVYKEEVSVGEQITVIREIPKQIARNEEQMVLETNQDRYQVDGVFVLRDSIAPKHLVPGLKMEENHVHVNLKMETNIKGCYACGDIVGKPYQYIKAAGQGNVAALSAVEYIDNQQKGL